MLFCHCCAAAHQILLAASALPARETPGARTEGEAGASGEDHPIGCQEMARAAGGKTSRQAHHHDPGDGRRSFYEVRMQLSELSGTSASLQSRLPNLNSFLAYCMQYFCCVTVPPAVRPTLLRQMDRGSLTCAQILGACHTHEVGSGTKKSAQELTRRDEKTVPHSVSPEDRTQGLRI